MVYLIYMTKLQQKNKANKQKSYMKICRPYAKMCIEFLYSIKWRVGGENNLQNYFKMAEERCCLLCAAEAMKLGLPK